MALWNMEENEMEKRRRDYIESLWARLSAIMMRGEKKRRIIR